MINRFLSTGWAKKKGQSGGREVFFSFHFALTRLIKLSGKKMFSKIMKKSSSRPFFAHLGGVGGGQETTFYLSVASPKVGPILERMKYFLSQL